jgi:hypothetical protein
MKPMELVPDYLHLWRVFCEFLKRRSCRYLMWIVEL